MVSRSNIFPIRDFLKNVVHTRKIMVVGDVMLDRYLYGEVVRISPEAPVPVNHICEEKDVLGGAANVANNLAKLGCQVSLLGVVSDDHHGTKLKEMVGCAGIENDGVIIGRESTTTKIRIVGGHQQMMRLDFEEADPIACDVARDMVFRAREILDGGVDAIILSDYGKGVCTDELCQQIISMGNNNGVPVFVDPRGDDWEKYRGALYVTPNVKETSVVLKKKLQNEAEVLRDAAAKIKEKYGIKNVMITRSEKGIILFGEDVEMHMPTIAKEVFDVSGAGDTVIAAFAAGIAGGLCVNIAIRLANLAAGISVGKAGTYAVSRGDVLGKIKLMPTNAEY